MEAWKPEENGWRKLESRKKTLMEAWKPEENGWRKLESRKKTLMEAWKPRWRSLKPKRWHSETAFCLQKQTLFDNFEV